MGDQETVETPVAAEPEEGPPAPAPREAPHVLTTHLCGACGRAVACEGCADPTTHRPPTCVTGQEPHQLPPAPGFPTVEWRRLNPAHPYLHALETARADAEAARQAAPAPAAAPAGPLVWTGSGWGPPRAGEA